MVVVRQRTSVTVRPRVFSEKEKARAIEFAQALAERRYADAHVMLAEPLASGLREDELRRQFEYVVPTDWGEVDPIELFENDSMPYVYVVLGGAVYSEALVVEEFETRDDEILIARFELGRL